MVRSLRLFSIVAILGVVAALVLPACGQGVSPSAYQAPVEKQPQCTATAVAGTLICIDGNGNVIYIGAPTPTPTPSGSPSATACRVSSPRRHASRTRVSTPAVFGSSGAITAIR